MDYSPDSWQAIGVLTSLWFGVLFAAALPLLLLVSLHVCLAGLCLLSVALDRRLAAAALPLLKKILV